MQKAPSAPNERGSLDELAAPIMSINVDTVDSIPGPSSSRRLSHRNGPTSRTLPDDDSNEIMYASRDSLDSDGPGRTRSEELPATVTGSMSNLVELSVVSVRFVYCYRYVTVELLMFLFCLAMQLTSPVTTAQYLVHTCRASLGFNVTTCASLEVKALKELEDMVQPKANIYIMCSMLIENCIPAVLSLFVGPWSDKNGRKTFLTAPLLGYVLKYLMYMLFSMFPSLPPGYLLLASLPVSFSGGFIALISLSYCYITDITPEKQRGFRMGVLQASNWVGLLIGTATSTYLFRYGGYVASYGTACAFCLVAFVYGVFFLPESVTMAKKGCCILRLFDRRLVVDMFRTCMRKRENGGRAIIFLTVFAVALAILTMAGESGVQFLFTREKFGWDIEHYNVFSSADILVHTVGTLLAVSVLSRWLGIDDTPLAIVSCFFNIGASVMWGFSPAWWYFYAASFVGLMGGAFGPFCRAILSKTVPPQDTGKVFSLLSCLEAMTPLAAGPLYTLIYNATIVWFPGTIYLLSAGLWTVSVLLLCVVMFIQRRASSTGYTSLLVE